MPILENHEQIKRDIRYKHGTMSGFAKKAGLDARETQYLYKTLNGLTYYAGVIPILEQHGYKPVVTGYRRNPKTAEKKSVKFRFVTIERSVA